MAKEISQIQLYAALGEIGEAALAQGQTLEIAIYGGSALMLASNFRYASEDVDVSVLDQPWPLWLTSVITEIARRFSWDDDWFNNAVEFHLSTLANKAEHHVLLGSFPKSAVDRGLKVYVPTAEYMLALKLKAIRIMDATKGEQERLDILNLVKVLGIETPERAIEVLAKFFPRSAADPRKHEFLLKHIWNEEADDAPSYAP